LLCGAVVRTTSLSSFAMLPPLATILRRACLLLTSVGVILTACDAQEGEADDAVTHAELQGDPRGVSASDEALFLAVGNRLERRELSALDREGRLLDEVPATESSPHRLGAVHAESGSVFWVRYMAPSQWHEAPSSGAQLLRAPASGGEAEVLVDDTNRWLVTVVHGGEGIGGCFDVLNTPGKAFFAPRHADGSVGPAQEYPLVGSPDMGSRNLYCGEVRLTGGELHVEVKSYMGESAVWVRYRSGDPPVVGVEAPGFDGWRLEGAPQKNELVRYDGGRREVVHTFDGAAQALLEDREGAYVGLRASTGNTAERRCYDGRVVWVGSTGRVVDVAKGQCGPVAITVAGDRVYWLDDRELTVDPTAPDEARPVHLKSAPRVE
jgi:hypothetical protein